MTQAAQRAIEGGCGCLSRDLEWGSNSRLVGGRFVQIAHGSVAVPVVSIQHVPDVQVLTGDSCSRSLTGATKLVTKAIVPSLLATDRNRGAIPLKRLEERWKPLAADDTVEIVRMWLLEPIHDAALCDPVKDAHAAEGSKMRTASHEQAIHKGAGKVASRSATQTCKSNGEA